MRKIVLSLVAAGAALAAASPAAAQYYPGKPYGYGYGYNGGYGFQNNWGEVQSLQARIGNVEHQINRLGRYDRIGDGRAARLRYQAERLEQRLHYAARGGLNPYEARDIRVGIDRLEQEVRYSLSYGYGRYGYGDRDDRWERDRAGD